MHKIGKQHILPTIQDELDYRGHHILFELDTVGDQMFCYWNDKIIEFGSGNTQYAEDMKALINAQLDTIARFKHYPGARLEWFDNDGKQSIRLIRWRYVLQIYQVDDLATLDLESIMSDAVKLLDATYLDSLKKTC